MLLACLVSLAMAQVSQPVSSPGKIDVPLTYQAFGQYGQIQIVFAIFKRQNDTREEKDIARYHVSSSVRSPKLFYTSILGKEYAIVVGRTRLRLKNPNLMWIDWNGDKVLSDDERAILTQANKPEIYDKSESPIKYAIFKPVSKGDVAQKVAIGVYHDYDIFILPRGMMVGTVPIGKGIKIGVCDENVDGHIDIAEPKSTDMLDQDLMIVDRNGKGRFDNLGIEPFYQDHNEDFYFLTSRVVIAGKFYKTEFKPDGTSMSLTPYPEPYGKLRFEGGTVKSLDIQALWGFIRIPVHDNVCELPEGRYESDTLFYEIRPKRREEWSFNLDLQQTRLFDIRSSQEVVWKIGLPLSIRLTHDPEDDELNFSLEVFDAGGNRVLNLERSERAKMEERDVPKLRIMTTNGVVLKILNGNWLNFGPWDVRKNVQPGTYLAEVTVDLRGLGKLTKKYMIEIDEFRKMTLSPSDP